jgi:hypothetical protein
MAGSTVQVATNQICGCGFSQGPAGPVHWGAGIYINVSQADLASATAFSVVPTSPGISYRLTSATGYLPPGTRLQVCTVPIPAGGGCPSVDNYCYGGPNGTGLIALGGFVPWSAFNTTCWSPATGSYLPARPPISQVQVEVASQATTNATPWDICVVQMTF